MRKKLRTETKKCQRCKGQEVRIRLIGGEQACRLLAVFVVDVKAK
jgi:hypothetical protein